MAITKEKKISIVKNLEAKLAKVNSVVFINFHGLSVANATELRKSLRAQDISLTVAKKTLIRRVLANRSVGGEMPELPGEIALAYPATPLGAGDDEALAPARAVYEFEKKLKDAVKIVGGIFEGKYADAALMLSIATIPGREVLYGKFVNIINSPIQRFVMALDQIAKKYGKI